MKILLIVCLGVMFTGCVSTSSGPGLADIVPRRVTEPALPQQEVPEAEFQKPIVAPPQVPKPALRTPAVRPVYDGNRTYII